MKTAIRFFLSLIFASSFWFAPLDVSARTVNLPMNWHHLYSNAWQHLESGENEDAEILLQEALISAQDDFSTTLMTLDMLEEAYERQSQYKNARKTLLQSLLTLKRNNFHPKKYAGYISLKLSLVNYHLQDFHKASFFALLAAPALRDLEEDGESVITIKHHRKKINLSHF